MRFVSFLSGGVITYIIVNPPERKLALRTSVHWWNSLILLPSTVELGNKELFGRLKLFLNAKCSLSLWCKWQRQIGHGKWFLNTNKFVIKPLFVIAKFDCTFFGNSDKYFEYILDVDLTIFERLRFSEAQLFWNDFWCLQFFQKNERKQF